VTPPLTSMGGRHGFTVIVRLDHRPTNIAGPALRARSRDPQKEAHQPDEAGDGGVLPPPKHEEQQYQKGWRWPWFVKWGAWPAVIFCSAVGIALENSHRLSAIFFFVLPWGVMAYFTRATKVRTDRAARSGKPAPAGWYPDPGHRGHGLAMALTGKLRYFDGTAWTDELRGYPTGATAWGSWNHPRIRMALGVVVLASAAILTVLACLTSRSHWACTSRGPYLDCGPRVSIGPISYGAAGNLLDPYVEAALVPPL
jgi:hypothetical protein